MPEICQQDAHCSIGGSDKTEYANFTTHLPSYTGVSQEESDGAIQVINAGFESHDYTFTSCTSTNGDGGGIYIHSNIPNTQTSYSINLKKIVV